MNLPHTIEADTVTIAVRLSLTGRVQGVGLRPAVARWASELGLHGHVGNTRQGVEVCVEGGPDAVGRFEAELQHHLPAAARLEEIECEQIAPAGHMRFSIVETDDNGPVTAAVPEDRVVCDACLEDVASPTNRRADYPFTSCTDCGPRYSMIDSLPYERAQTGMSRFSMCPDCLAEYESPQDRRFHSQTNACDSCGPHVWCCDASGRRLAEKRDAITCTAKAIQQGRIVALRGLGGYQLLVDATSSSAVSRLRSRKLRDGKPLAVMVSTVEEAERLAVLNAVEKRSLRSPAGPIVVARARHQSLLSPEIAPGLNSVGIMLPTTPLHWLLLRDCSVPLVVTSGNRDGEPIAYQRRSSQVALAGIADIWLEHDRPIRRPIDDSVVRVMADRAVTIRLARGLAPLSLDLPGSEAVCALGGHQKSAVAICNGAQAVLGPHVGDLETLATRERYLEQLDDLQELYGCRTMRFVADQHPDYFTKRWGEEQRSTIETVQHHHAHVVAGMVEHNWLDRTVLGVSFDGTGYGDEGTIWGGEFLLSTATGFRRVGHLRPFQLPGGETAVREPWRVAAALVHQASGPESLSGLPFNTRDVQSLLPVLRSKRLAPVTTSAGRLFDGVAALVLGIAESEFEGQAAMLLEAVCDDTETGCYQFDQQSDGVMELDWRPVISAILRDRNAGVSPGAMAMRFHRGLAVAIARLCRGYAHLPVVLGGGVFQNRVLVELIAEEFAASSQPLGLPGAIPPNDGGLAAGQLAVALARAKLGVERLCV